MKRNLFVAALTLCCSMLVFNAQPVMAAVGVQTFEGYPTAYDIPSPEALGNTSEEISRYVSLNGESAVNYILIDYGSDWNNPTNDFEYATHTGDDMYISGTFIGNGSSIPYPQSRYLYVIYGADTTLSFSVSSSLEAQFGIEMTITSPNMAIAYFNDSTGSINFVKNTFGSGSSDSYTFYFGRYAFSQIDYNTSGRYPFRTSLYPAVLGFTDSTYLNRNYVTPMIYYNYITSSYTVHMQTTTPLTDYSLDKYTFNYVIQSQDEVFLNELSPIVVSVFGFISEVALLVSSYPLLLLLLCIPLVGLAIGVFKSFTSR